MSFISSRKSLAQSTGNLGSISSDCKPCPHEVLFMQLHVLDFDKFLKRESKKRGLAFLKTIAFNGDMFRKSNKAAFQAVVYFLTVKFAQLFKKTKWVESIKFPCQSHEDEASFRRNFTEMIESLEKDPSFSSAKLPAIKIQLFQCHGDQLVFLLSKVASFILLHHLPRTVKENISQRTMTNISCQDANQQRIAATKEAVSSLQSIKIRGNQELGNTLETFPEFKFVLYEAKCDNDKLKSEITTLRSQVEMKFGATNDDKTRETLSTLSHQICEKREAIKCLMNDKFTLALFTADSLITCIDCKFGDDLSLLEVSTNLIETKSKLDEHLASVSRRQLLQLKEKANETLSRLSQHKVQAEENLSSLTLMADDLKSLVNKQKSRIENSEEFQERKRQAKKLLSNLQIERLAALSLKPCSPVNGVRAWHSLIPAIVDNYQSCNSESNSRSAFDQETRTILSPNTIACPETSLPNFDFDISRLSILNSVDASASRAESTDHNTSGEVSSLLTDQLTTSALIDASSIETIEE